MRKIIQHLYKIKLLKRIIPSILKRIIRLFNLNEVIIKKNNFLLLLNLNNPIDREIYLRGNYEAAQINFLSEEIKKNNLDIFIDVGAHMGFYSITMAEQKISVYSFEPIKNNFEQLKKNIKINNITNIIEYNIALSDKKQIIDLWVTDVNKTGGFSVYDEQDEELKKYNSNSITTIKGLCDRADNILTLKDNRIAIKIDVERHEENVLVGMKKILDQNKILMQIEIFDTRKDRIFSLLKKSGFRLINNIEKDYYFKNF
tara:strand:+ start:644 stop:1417 length:774 start_codon:yes stop_codon:yes gene_type:complete